MKTKIIKSRQRKVATTRSKKDTKFRGLNKRMMELEAEVKDYVLTLHTLILVPFTYPEHRCACNRARMILEKYGKVQE